jgi:hypothetical protein
MKTFRDENGQSWVATATREDTERHHGTWFLIFHPEGDLKRRLDVGEVRWQTRATAERTLLTMSEFELRRRLHSALVRHSTRVGPTGIEGEGQVPRGRTNVNAG